jgi:hypothetical protein
MPDELGSYDSSLAKRSDKIATTPTPRKNPAKGAMITEANDNHRISSHLAKHSDPTKPTTIPVEITGSVQAPVSCQNFGGRIDETFQLPSV